MLILLTRKAHCRTPCFILKEEEFMEPRPFVKEKKDQVRKKFLLDLEKADSKAEVAMEEEPVYEEMATEGPSEYSNVENHPIDPESWKDGDVVMVAETMIDRVPTSGDSETYDTNRVCSERLSTVEPKEHDEEGALGLNGVSDRDDNNDDSESDECMIEVARINCFFPLILVMENRSSISDLLVRALNNLLQEDFKRFKDKLSHSDFKRNGIIPQGQLEHADRIDTKNLLMKFYGAETAMDVTIDIFTQLNFRDAAEKLREDGEKGIKDLRTSTAYSLCQGLKDPNCKLKTISLSSCKLSSAFPEHLSPKMLFTNWSLEKLDLSANTLGDSGLKHLCEGLKHPHCKLQILLLWQCHLTAACCGDLAAALSTNQSLTELELSGNKLGDSGIKVLCEGLKHARCKLQKLVVWDCHLTDACCGALSSLLSTNQSLRELNLSGNNLSYSGVKLLCEGLKHPNCQLQKLDLSENHIDERTTKELDVLQKIKP
ncbi:hypothetical protein KIL84_007400, partial [Mauremys mutica]